ncbi:hypothetical protein ZWY2020_035211 [Hordeum vulgare]|nr:hypothetical protein ZWY2020_035211 [Hordeum vulgare]
MTGPTAFPRTSTGGTMALSAPSRTRFPPILWSFYLSSDLASAPDLVDFGGSSLVAQPPGVGGANYRLMQDGGALRAEMVDRDHECDPSEPDSCDAGCNGGLMASAFSYLLKSGGLEREKDYPYTGKDGTCKFDKSKIDASVQNYSVVAVDEEQIAANLVKYGPLAIGINAAYMQTYIGGLSCPYICGRHLDHGVLLVGYGASGFAPSRFKEKPYWIVKNSWGENWGTRVAIKETFGKFDAILQPGCHCLPWCLGQQVAGYLSLRVQQLDVRCETKTKDNVFVNVVASVQYRALADKASDAFYRLSNTREQIQSYVFDVIRASVPKMNLDDVFEQKNEIARAVEEELEKAMSAYGYEIVQTLIVDIEPDEHVKRAMNEINAAARMRLAATEKAEAEKILQIKRAEGEAESKYLAGVGIARQRQAIVDGLRDSVLAFSENVPGTSSKDVMDMVLVTQYFDTMKDIGASSKSSAVFIPHGPGAVKDIASQIRDGQLQGRMV